MAENRRESRRVGRVAARIVARPALRACRPAVRVLAPHRIAAGPLLYPIFHLIDTLLWLYIMVLIISAILSWLVAFNVINTRNRAVYLVGDFCHRVTEPALRPIRRLLPSLGGIDISPIILILLLQMLREYLPALLTL